MALAQAAHDAARANRGVQAGLMGSYGASETDYTLDTVTLNPFQAGLKAEWTFYSSGRLGAAVDRTDRQRDAASFGAQSLREQTILDTLTAYANLWLADQALTVRIRKVETLEIRKDETAARFRQGLITQTDVALTDARVAGAEAEMEAARAMRSAALAQLERLTGLEAPSATELIYTQLITPPDFEAALMRALENSSQLAAAREAQKAAEAGVREARGAFGPNVSLSAQASTAKDSWFLFEDEINEVGASVNFRMPLFTSGLKGASVRQAQAARARANAQLRQAELAVREGVSALWGDIAARSLALKAAGRGEEAAIKVAEGARREYEGGLRTLVDALDAEDERRAAEIFTLTAKRELFLSRAKLLVLTADIEAQLLSENK